MAGFIFRKNQRFKDSVPVRYRGPGIVGEGIVKDLSLSGGHIRGNMPVMEGMALELQITFPGDPALLLIDRATVQWIKGLDFGVEVTPQRQVAERITKIIAELVAKQHGFRKTL